VTVKELRERLENFNDDAMVLLSTVEGHGYYPNIELRRFLSTKNDLMVIGCKNPYINVPFNVIEAGWRPGAGS